jgi:hypothetical protein
VARKKGDRSGPIFQSWPKENLTKQLMSDSQIKRLYQGVEYGPRQRSRDEPLGVAMYPTR